MPVARIRQDARESYAVVANENDIYGKTNIRYSVFVIFIIRHETQTELKHKKNCVDCDYKEK